MHFIYIFSLRLDKSPCRTNPCGKNEICTPFSMTGERNCTCKENFETKDGICVKTGVVTHKNFFLVNKKYPDVKNHFLNSEN